MRVNEDDAGSAARPEGPRTYPALLEILREVSRDNQVSGTVDRERRRTRTYWEMGDEIHRHLLGHEGKPRYGDQVISKLANDLEMGKTLLYDILRLRRAFPNFHTCGKLPWSHSRQLVGLETLVEREFYARVAVEMGWSVRQLRYGRYLADVFYSTGVSDPAAVAAKGTYLNRQLLDEGLAGAYV